MTLLHGFDISAYNDLAPAADFWFVKATEGKGYTSSHFGKQWAAAPSKTKIRGAYHFARPEESSFKDQAARLLDVMQPKRGEVIWLDLEVSKLSQSETNAWARGWGDYVRSVAAGIRSGAYFGGGYATNGTGRDLSKHFDLWWYPQYPSAYQLTHELTLGTVDLEARRAENRSSLVFTRTRIARATAKWPTSVSPWLPSGLTCGWTKPHLWQFTDNFSGLDATVSTLMLSELSGTSTPTPPPPPPPPATGVPIPSPKLDVDGVLGTKTVTALQRVLAFRLRTAVAVSGKMSAATVRALQHYMKVSQDGELGPVTIKALQRHVGASADGELGPVTIRDMQKKINAGAF